MWIDPWATGLLIAAITVVASIGWRQAFLAGDGFRAERNAHAATKRRLEDVELLRKRDATAGWAPTHRHVSGYLYRLDEEFVAGHFDGASLQGVLCTGSGGYKAWVNNRQWRAEFTELTEGEELFPDGPRCVLCESHLEPCAFCRKGLTAVEHRRPVRATARANPDDLPSEQRGFTQGFIHGQLVGGFPRQEDDEPEVYPDMPGPDEFPDHEPEEGVIGTVLDVELMEGAFIVKLDPTPWAEEFLASGCVSREQAERQADHFRSITDHWNQHPSYVAGHEERLGR